MKTEPISTARLSSRLLCTVMKRTASCGCASAPMPTPSIRLDTNVHHQMELKRGIAVQPTWPSRASCGSRSATSGAMSVSA